MKAFLLLLTIAFSMEAFSKVEIENKQLFGSYLREQITDASRAPYSFVGKIGTGCTATLIGPKHVITAAHCVYDLQARQLMTYLFFTPRQVENGQYPFGRIKAKKIFLQKEFIETTDAAYDFAVIELSESIGDKVGWAKIQVVTNEVALKNIRITGYPQDEILDTMWTVTCPAKIKGTKILYMCDTYNGMSGSSIFSSSAGLGPAIYGIHSWGSDESNGGVVINQRNFEIIKGWMDEVNVPGNTVSNLYNDSEVIKNYLSK